MKSAFVIFFSSQDPKKQNDYLKQMEVCRKALELTNPGMDLIVLTDKETAPALKGYDTRVIADSSLPLMLRYTLAQAEFERTADYDLVVLAEADCLANRNLQDAIPRDHGLGITYRPRRAFRHEDFDEFILPPINNLAYVRDHELAEWFLRRACKFMEDMPTLEWWADQAAWHQALKPWGADSPDLVVREARPEGRLIHLYPCQTHNHFPLSGLRPKKLTKDAFIIHFKGERKHDMEPFFERYVKPWASTRSK